MLDQASLSPGNYSSSVGKPLVLLLPAEASYPGSNNTEERGRRRSTKLRGTGCQCAQRRSSLKSATARSGRAWHKRGSRRTCQNEGTHHHPVVRAWLATGSALQDRSLMRAVAREKPVVLQGASSGRVELGADNWLPALLSRGARALPAAGAARHRGWGIPPKPSEALPVLATPKPAMAGQCPAQAELPIAIFPTN